MPTDDKARKGLVLEQSNSRIWGVPLQNREIGSWIPIRPCICVMEPCPCDDLDDVIVWVPSNVKGVKTGKQFKGEDILSYKFSPDTKLMLQIPVTIGQLQNVKDSVENNRKGSQFLLRRKQPASKRSKPSTGGWLIAAWQLGYEIGTKIDEETGASDEISDWLAEHIPWPF